MECNDTGCTPVIEQNRCKDEAREVCRIESFGESCGTDSSLPTRENFHTERTHELRDLVELPSTIEGAQVVEGTAQADQSDLNMGWGTDDAIRGKLGFLYNGLKRSEVRDEWS